MNVTDVLPVYPHLLEKIADNLRNLSAEEWENSTVLPNWRIKDIAAHIASGALRKLTAIYDDNLPGDLVQIGFRTLVREINANNEEWVSLLRSLHPVLIIEVIKDYYGLLIEEFQKMNPLEKAIHAVAWAGENVSENWFDIAREYTELWHHGMQIADSLGETALLDDCYFIPFIETCFQALPFHFRNIKEKKFKLYIEIEEMVPG